MHSDQAMTAHEAHLTAGILESVRRYPHGVRAMAGGEHSINEDQLELHLPFEHRAEEDDRVMGLEHLRGRRPVESTHYMLRRSGLVDRLGLDPGHRSSLSPGISQRFHQVIPDLTVAPVTKITAPVPWS